MSSKQPFAPHAVKAPDKLEPLAVEGRKPVLLLVEDNRTNQILGKVLLEHLGCKVEVVADGAGAVRGVRDRAYDLVLMDLSMPVLDGTEATRRLRALGVTIPIVALTATATPADREQLKAAGFNGCLMKPVTAAALRAAIASTLAASIARRR